MGSLAYMDNDEYTDVSGERYSRTIAINVFVAEGRARASE